MGVRRRVLLVAMMAVTGGLAYGGWWSWRELSYRAAMADIRARIDAGRHATAARDLTELLARDPDSDEAAYLLGLCEKNLGRPGAATRTWDRIPVGSRFGVSAVLGRAAILVDGGRFAAAEDLIDQTLRDPRISGFDLRRFLTPLLWHEGRLEEARRLVEANWDVLDRAGGVGSSVAVQLVRLHVLLSLGTSSLERLEDFLERAGRLAPDDDRVWLGKANLAIRNGAFDEAARRLDACLRSRPRDVAVWRARLSWAVATARVDEARECAAHLPAGDCTPGEVYKLGAWLAERRGDARAERRALELLIAADPADGTALDRLAVLADREPQPGRAAELRRRRAELDQTIARFKELFSRDQPLRDAPEMARLADRLGRVFEAKAFWSLAVAAEGDRGDLGEAPAEQTRRSTRTAAPGQTVAEVLASLPESDAPSP